MKCFSVILALLVLLLAAAAVFVYSGAYNVSAISRESNWLAWLLRTAREQSVHRNAEGIIPPPLSNPELVRLGFRHYDEMCVICHGAPGIAPGEAHDGLNPKPPHLDQAAKAMSPAELFWVVKNGIKMTGMPAWGPTHSDELIWAMVAFVRQLPEMNAAQYLALRKQAENSHESNDEHEHSGTPAHQHAH